jgi:signal transduction histidine kinase
VPSTRLLESSTFRLTVVHLGLFVGAALALLVFVYHASISYMERQAVDAIEREMDALLDQRSPESLRRAVERQARADPGLSRVYLLLDRTGGSVAGTPVAFERGLPPEGQYVRTELHEWDEEGQEHQRPFLVVRRELSDGGSLVVGHDITDKVRTQRVLLAAIALGGGVLVLMGVGGGLAVARNLTRRIEAMNQITARIMAGDLGQRIAVNGGGDEFDELARNLNAMLERIERLLVGMRQVTDNIAHDLRTPLTRMRSRLEVALMSPGDETQSRELIEQTLKDADGLIATFNALLSIARIEAGAARSEWEVVDLAELAADVAELYGPLAEERHMTLRVDAPRPVLVHGSRQLLAQAAANLVDNAIKYAPEHARVSIVVRDQPVAALEVTDTGPGIPPEQRELALRRFVRLAPDRSTPGNGLGLSLVSAVAQMHEAELELGDARPGLRVSLRFTGRSARVPAEPLPAAAE